MPRDLGGHRSRARSQRVWDFGRRSVPAYVSDGAGPFQRSPSRRRAARRSGRVTSCRGASYGQATASRSPEPSSSSGRRSAAPSHRVHEVTSAMLRVGRTCERTSFVEPTNGFAGAAERLRPRVHAAVRHRSPRRFRSKAPCRLPTAASRTFTSPSSATTRARARTSSAGTRASEARPSAPAVAQSRPSSTEEGAASRARLLVRAPARAPGARAPCPRPGCPRGTRRAPRSRRAAPGSPSRTPSPSRAASATSASATGAGKSSRPWSAAASASVRPARAGRAPPRSRPIGLSESAAPASSAHRASSSAPSRSPRDQPRLHRADRPPPASGRRQRPALAVALGRLHEPRRRLLAPRRA